MWIGRTLHDLPLYLYQFLFPPCCQCEIYNSWKSERQVSQSRSLIHPCSAGILITAHAHSRDVIQPCMQNWCLFRTRTSSIFLMAGRRCSLLQFQWIFLDSLGAMQANTLEARTKLQIMCAQGTGLKKHVMKHECTSIIPTGARSSSV